MKHFFVINPHSFRVPGTMEQVLTEIKNVFPPERSLDYETYISRYPRDAIAAIHRYISRFSPQETVRVYAIGGDGILFDCLNGMIDIPNAEISSVPYGNANDFVRAFGENAKQDFRDLKKLLNAPSRLIDSIHCGSNYAINQIGIGLSGQGTISAQLLMRRFRSKWIKPFVKHIYTFCSAAAFLNGEVMSQQYHVLLDGEDISGAYHNIHVANGPCAGGKMVLDPYAKPDDGLLGVIFGIYCPSLTAVRTIGDFTKGHYEKHTTYFRRQFKKMEIKSDVPMRVHMDGEAFYTDGITIEAVPQSVRFFAPEGLSFADYSHRAAKGGRDK